MSRYWKRKNKGIFITKEVSIMFKDNKIFVAESIFIKEALKKNLSLNEFIKK